HPAAAGRRHGPRQDRTARVRPPAEHLVPVHTAVQLHRPAVDVAAAGLVRLGPAAGDDVHRPLRRRGHPVPPGGPAGGRPALARSPPAAGRLMAKVVDSEAGWRNWSGSVSARPRQVARPETETALAELVRASPKVRPAGSGHSFMPLCETDGVLVLLDRLPGKIEVAADRASAWVPANWPLHQLTQALWDEGLALANQGDIDKQTLA